MLLRFGCSNHLSIREYQELSFIASSRKDITEGLTQVTGTKLKALPIVAVYGANASGKSNILKSLLFMKHMVVFSQGKFRPEMPIDNIPFGLDPSAKSDESHFECEFIEQAVRYIYGFTILKGQIAREFLYAFPRGHKQTWFLRDESSNKKNFEFGKNLRGRNSIVAELTRSNSLFLSTAAQQNHEQLQPVYSYFSKKLNTSFSLDEAEPDSIVRLLEGGKKNWVLDFLKTADTGIGDAKIEDVEIDNEVMKAVDAAIQSLNSTRLGSSETQTIKFESKFMPKSVTFGHVGREGSVNYFPWRQESAGTKRLLQLLVPILAAVELGGVAIIDEIDSSLHTLLAFRLIDLFRDETFNDRGAQLLFSTHDTNLLCHGHLRQDEIWFVEKNRVGETHVYPLSDFKLRSTDRIEKGYLQGRFGAVPFIGTFKGLHN